MPSDPGPWIFAYGSLLWRPGFESVESCPARLRGWARRFWQGSPDHRGTPGDPGRVVTLVPRAQSTTGGLAYHLPAAGSDEVLQQLDVREQGGYQRQAVELELGDGRRVTALTWVAVPDNPHFLGPASHPEIARHIARAHGPSGSNREYFERLARSLCSIAALDAHTRRIGRWLLTREPKR